LTSVVQAGTSGWTVCISYTLDLSQCWNGIQFGRTEDKWIANISWWTGARCIVIDHFANGRWSTDIVQETRIQTLALDTGFAGVTVIVDITFNRITMFIGIANQSWRTDTSSGMIDSLTNGIESARIGNKTRIDAFVDVANLVGLTIPINLTLHFN
jgi:hypothetical protein